MTEEWPKAELVYDPTIAEEYRREHPEEYRIQPVLKAETKGPGTEYADAYMEGFENGYQTAIKEMIKKLGGMKWYGGDHKEKRAAGMPEHHEGGTAAVQQTLQRAGAKKRNGRSMEARAEED